jgi:hypothetical protein
MTILFKRMQRLNVKVLLLVVYSALFLSACFTAHTRESGSDDQKSFSQRLGGLHTDSPRKRVLLLPFLNDSLEKDPSVARTGRDSLVRGLRMTDNFVILDNNDIPKDLKQYQKDQGYDLDAVGKIASELGVVAIIEGRVIEIKAKKSGDEVGLIRSVTAQVQSTVGVKVFSVSNRKEILNEVRSASSVSKSHRVAETGKGYSLAADPELIQDSLVSAFQGMILPITKAVDKLSWAGRIAMVSSDRVYLNAGRITGLNVGDILRVTEKSEEVYDSETGVLIGKAPGRIKGTLEVVSYFGKDGAIAVIHSGSGFKENDFVELY